MEITRWMKIEEIVRRYPETIPVFDRYGVVCVECCGAEVDSVERGAIIHGLDLEQFLRDLNACLVGRAA